MIEGAETKTWIDKSEWGEGPWRDEPDRVEWRDPATGLPCLMIRNSNGGHWCGYVGVPPEHPWHDDPPEDLHNAHGGVTYTAPCFEGDGPDDHLRICHVPRPGESDHVLWIGFDCAHYGDTTPGWWGIPGMRRSVQRLFRDGVYRSLDYVMDCCASMAGEVAAAQFPSWPSPAPHSPTA